MKQTVDFLFTLFCCLLICSVYFQFYVFSCLILSIFSFFELPILPPPPPAHTCQTKIEIVFNRNFFSMLPVDLRLTLSICCLIHFAKNNLLNVIDFIIETEFSFVGLVLTFFLYGSENAFLYGSTSMHL